MTDAIQKVREALKPFAALADIFDNDGGNRPKTGVIAQWADHRVGEREFTVEDLRAARDALAAIRAYLASATPADVGEEPVAWRYRSPWLRPKQGLAEEASGYGPWHYSADEATIRVRREAGDQVQPLYSATALERVVRDRDTLRARLETVEAETRERIAAALDEEADLIPCAEDAMVTRSNARLVRANFSYEDAERLEAEEDAAAIRNLEPRHD